MYIRIRRRYLQIKKIIFSPLSRRQLNSLDHERRFVRRRQARGSPPYRRAVARYTRECKPPEPWVFSKNLPGFLNFSKIYAAEIRLTLNSRSGDKPQAESVNPRACSLRRPGVLLAGP